MSKSRRQIELMITLNTKRRFTAGELAREFGVSKRTILRDLQELTEAGLPLYSEPGAAGGYQMLKEKTLPPILFSENEAVAMFFAYQSLRDYADLPFQPESLSALKKFTHYLPEETRQRINGLRTRFTFWTPQRHVEAPHLAGLLEQAVEQRVIRIRYDANTDIVTRKIQPIGIYATNGLWYCPAYCFERSAIRVFRVDRITAIEAVEDQSGKRNYDKLSVQEYLSLSDEEGASPLHVLLDKEGVRRCSTETWMAEGLTVYEDGTGTISRMIRPDFIPWAARFFVSFGKEARVEQPAALVAAIRELIAELSVQYPGSG
ncbi:helix-turn-helix transcriptional regulator [Paenibacillus chitinolyticus]